MFCKSELNQSSHLGIIRFVQLNRVLAHSYNSELYLKSASFDGSLNHFCKRCEKSQLHFLKSGQSRTWQLWMPKEKLKFWMNSSLRGRICIQCNFKVQLRKTDYKMRSIISPIQMASEIRVKPEKSLTNTLRSKSLSGGSAYILNQYYLIFLNLHSNQIFFKTLSETRSENSSTCLTCGTWV